MQGMERAKSLLKRKANALCLRYCVPPMLHCKANHVVVAAFWRYSWPALRLIEYRELHRVVASRFLVLVDALED